MATVLFRSVAAWIAGGGLTGMFPRRVGLTPGGPPSPSFATAGTGGEHPLEGSLEFS
jgi:hypothetical protein